MQDLLKNLERSWFFKIFEDPRGSLRILKDPVRFFTRDVEIMVRELSQQDVFSKIPGRCHSTFPNHPRNLLEWRWMTTLVKKFSNGQYLYAGPEIDSDQSDSDEE